MLSREFCSGKVASNFHETWSTAGSSQLTLAVRARLYMHTEFSEFAGLEKWAIKLLNNLQADLYILRLQEGSLTALYWKWCNTIQQMVTYLHLETFYLENFFPKHQCYCNSSWSMSQGVSSLVIKNVQLVTALVKVRIFHFKCYYFCV